MQWGFHNPPKIEAEMMGGGGVHCGLGKVLLISPKFTSEIPSKSWIQMGVLMKCRALENPLNHEEDGCCSPAYCKFFPIFQGHQGQQIGFSV